MDSLESVPRARALYLMILELLALPEMQPTGGAGFVVNPIPDMLQLHASINLFKLRNSRNIAGMQRQVQTYNTQTRRVGDSGANGNSRAAGTPTLHPTPYRYSTLIERAKQLVAIAQQIEASYLAALERFDAE